MAHITHPQGTIESHRNESVLDALIRHGIPWPYRCRTGQCHACLTRAIDGTPTTPAQNNLSSIQVERHLFLACQCIPIDDLTIDAPTHYHHEHQTALIHDITMLSPNILRLRLETQGSFLYEAGQYTAIATPNGLIRDYCLASLPNHDPWLEFHICLRQTGYDIGPMGHWLTTQAQPGMLLTLHGARGDCVITPDWLNVPIIMIGIGMGCSPLWGLLRMLIKERRNTYPFSESPITLYHATRTTQNLYLDAALRDLAAQHAYFHYQPCILSNLSNDSEVLIDNIYHQCLNLQAAHLFLCGDATCVQALREWAILAGINPQNIRYEMFTAFEALTLTL